MKTQDINRIDRDLQMLAVALAEELVSAGSGYHYGDDDVSVATTDVLRFIEGIEDELRDHLVQIDERNVSDRVQIHCAALMLRGVREYQRTSTPEDALRDCMPLLAAARHAIVYMRTRRTMPL